MQQATCHLPPLPAGQARLPISGRASGGAAGGVRRRCSAPAAASLSSSSSSSLCCWPHGNPVMPAAAAVPCSSRPQRLGCGSRGLPALRSRVVPRTLFSDWGGGGTNGSSSSSSNGRSSSSRPGFNQQQPSSQQQPGPSNFFTIAAQAALGASTHLSGSSGGAASSQQQQFSDSTGSGSDGGGGALGASAKQLLQTAVHSLDMFEPRELGSSSYEEADAGMESYEEGGSQAGTLATAHIVKANYEVLRLDEAGAVRRLRIKRRDLLREHRLQPRDLRRIDPTIDFTKASPSITIKEDVLLLNLGGIRAIVTGDKALLFEPASSNTRKLLDTLVPRLQASAGQRLLARQQQVAAAGGGGADGGGSSSGASNPRQAGSRAPPFELEVLEGVLMVATGRLDAEVLSVTRRVGELLQKLPRDINPVNLEELRRIKQALVELENKSDMLREMLEQIMDDEDELREINLSSRPRREERRKQRERERMERQLTRAREEMEEQARRNSSSSNGGDADDRRSSSGGGGGGGGGNGSSSSSTASGSSGSQPAPAGSSGGSSSRDSGSNRWQPTAGSSSSSSGGSSSGAGSSARQQRLAELYARHGMRRGPGGVLMPSPKGGSSSGGGGSSGSGSSTRPLLEASKQQWDEQWRPAIERDGLLTMSRDPQQQQQRDGSSRERERDRDREGDPEEEFQDAQDALEELAEQEEEEEELEEVEDLLEYYLQRSSATQSEAERLLEGARDLEESIGVSLSARRYEVNRLELMLSMGSFAAALGAMIAGIFGMNMKSTLEMSVAGFWGVTGSIVVGCFYIALAIMRYSQKKRIL